MRSMNDRNGNDCGDDWNLKRSRCCDNGNEKNEIWKGNGNWDDPTFY